MGTLTRREYEEYINECQSVVPVEETGPEEEDSSFMDDPAEWLREAGFDLFLSDIKDIEDQSALFPDDISIETDGSNVLDVQYDDVMSTYTYSQQQTVRRKLQDYQTTVRLKKTKFRPPDVRDVFASTEDVTEADSRFRSQSYGETSTVDRGVALRPQSSVDDTRIVLRASPEERSFMNEAASGKAKKGAAFLRSGNKQGYKVSSDTVAGGDSGGIEVLSFSYRSSLKRQPQMLSEYNGSQLPIVPSNPSSSNSSLNLQEQQVVVDLPDLGFEVLETPNSSIDALPEARVLTGPLGVTSASDLGKEDSKRMRSLALIELTAFFDEHGLSYSRRKAAKKKLKVFGSSLLSLVEEDRRRYPGCKVPMFLEKVLRQLEHRGLHEEGLLRIAGSRQKVEALKSLVDSTWRSSPRTVEEAMSQASVHDVVSLLKNFIRELPEPLLTYKYMDAFLKATDLSSIVDQLRALNLLIVLLPEVNRETLKRLTSFMVSVASASARNRMSAQNVAVIMAPNLFPPKGSLKKDTVLTHEVAGAAKSASVTKMLIHYHHCLWIVPPSLLRQVREQNAEMVKNKIQKGAKKLNRKNRDEAGKVRRSSAGITERSITVEVTGPKLRTVPVSVDSSTSVRDVLEAASGSFVKHRFAVSLEALDLLDSLHLDQELYEVGGNIVEHRLDPVARIAAILQVNPEARFQIRPLLT